MESQGSGDVTGDFLTALLINPGVERVVRGGPGRVFPVLEEREMRLFQSCVLKMEIWLMISELASPKQ